MLNASHLTGLRLERFRMEKVWEFPTPWYTKSQLTQQTFKLGETILAQLLKLDPEAFQRQILKARERNVSMLIQRGGKAAGISVAVSMLKSGSNIMHRHVIVPREVASDAHQLRHFIVAAFVRGNVEQGQLNQIDEVTIAGWTTAYKLREYRDNEGLEHRLPQNFVTRLPGVAIMPCEMLEPITTLVPAIEQELEVEKV